MSGSFVLRLQTQDGLASQIAVVKAMGMPLDYLEKYINPHSLGGTGQSAIVVVGDAKKIGAAVEKFK